jgi:uncharacterized membrane protein YqhA
VCDTDQHGEINCMSAAEASELKSSISESIIVISVGLQNYFILGFRQLVKKTGMAT